MWHTVNRHLDTFNNFLLRLKQWNEEQRDVPPPNLNLNWVNRILLLESIANICEATQVPCIHTGIRAHSFTHTDSCAHTQTHKWMLMIRMRSKTKTTKHHTLYESMLCLSFGISIHTSIHAHICNSMCTTHSTSLCISMHWLTTGDSNKTKRCKEWMKEMKKKWENQNKHSTQTADGQHILVELVCESLERIVCFCLKFCVSPTSCICVLVVDHRWTYIHAFSRLLSYSERTTEANRKSIDHHCVHVRIVLSILFFFSLGSERSYKKWYSTCHTLFGSSLGMNPKRTLFKFNGNYARHVRMCLSMCIYMVFFSFFFFFSAVIRP